MIIYIGSDKTGYKLKDELKDYIQELGHQVIDLGVFAEGEIASTDIAREVAEKVYQNPGTFGALVSGLGTGMCMVANKARGIRALDCTNDTQAHYAREHNDANVLCISESLLGAEVAKRILKVFLETKFDPAHKAEVDKIDEVYEAD